MKAFNHFDVELLPQPVASGGQRVLFYSGDDLDAKSKVGELISGLSMFPVDLGGLAVGAALTAVPFGSLAMTEFVKI